MATTDDRANDERMRLLLAEDDEDMRALLATMFRGDRWIVTEVATGMELVRALSAWLVWDREPPFDLLISDVRMPGLSGLEVLRSIAVADEPLPTILITAFGDVETHREAESLGALAVFDKPLDLDQLRAVAAACRQTAHVARPS